MGQNPGIGSCIFTNRLLSILILIKILIKFGQTSGTSLISALHLKTTAGVQRSPITSAQSRLTLVIAAVAIVNLHVLGY